MFKYFIPLYGFIQSMDKFRSCAPSIAKDASILSMTKWFFISMLTMLWTFIWVGIIELGVSYQMYTGHWKFETVAYTILSISTILLLLTVFLLIKGLLKKK